MTGEFDRRLAIAIEAARNVAAATGRPLDLPGVRGEVLAGLDARELVAVVMRGLAGDHLAKEALGVLLLRLVDQAPSPAQLWLDGPSSQLDKSELEASTPIAPLEPRRSPRLSR